VHKQHRVAVFFSDEDERRRAEKALQETKPDGVDAYSGVLEGWLTVPQANRLDADGFALEFLELPPPPAPPRTILSADAVEELKSVARYASVEGELDALLVDETEAEVSDPRIHLYADYDPAPAPENALPSDVYYVLLAGPITREQRLEFDSFGVDIGAFLPPNRYRTFLSPDQLERVRKLDYVVGVVRRPFEDTVTPELLAVVDETSTAGPSLLSADEDASPHVFDVLVHRHRDVPEVRRLIEATQTTHVIATSNLRIRFEGPVNPPLLAALAALPAVRKLSPYEPPRL
jgi:hypothetical protein